MADNAKSLDNLAGIVICVK